MPDPTLFADLMPRRREVLVGDVVLLLEELTMDRWEAFMRVLAESLDWAKRLQPLAELVKGGEQADWKSVMSALLGNIDQMAGIFGDLLRDLLGARAPEVAVVALATDENAKRLGLTAGTPGSQAVDALRERLTVRQALAVLEALVEVTDVADVLGKSRSLARKTREAFRRTAGTPAAPASAA